MKTPLLLCLIMAVPFIGIAQQSACDNITAIEITYVKDNSMGVEMTFKNPRLFSQAYLSQVLEFRMKVVLWLPQTLLCHISWRIIMNTK